MAALVEFGKLPPKSVLMLLDFHMFLASDQNTQPNPVLVRKLKDVLLMGKNSNRHIISIGCQIKLPPELEKEITVIEFKLPTKEELLPVAKNVAESAGIELNGETDGILSALSGMTTIEAENACAKSVVEEGDIVPRLLAEEKCNAIRKSGLLELVDVEFGFGDVGGNDLIKLWVNRRIKAFTKEAREFGLPMPKGLFLLGVQGCGKSLICKAAAHLLGVPLLRLDAGKMFGSLVGQTEANARSVIALAEAVAPCCLWIDEIEKGFSGSRSSGMTDGGTGARVMGTFLTWLQEKKSAVFVLATANNITELPPELIRKGRWDEMFFVDLPDDGERQDIFAVQINRYRSYGWKAEDFSLDALAKATNGFSGAEIEGIVTEALFIAFDRSTPLSDETLAEVIESTTPLSRTMAQQIDALRVWSEGRARRASSRKAEQANVRKLA
jgi:ATP-dependent 26S proteasome regulatory subunit